MEKHLDCLLELSKQLPPKRWDEPETEGTVFRRFVGALRTNVRHLKVKHIELFEASNGVVVSQYE